jgi:hypothetical protein
MPWCQILIDDPDGRDERTFKRLIRNVAEVGDLIEVDGENVVVTSVSLIPPRPYAPDGLSVLVYCRQP